MTDIRDLKRLQMMLDAVDTSLKSYGRVAGSERGRMLRQAYVDCQRCLGFWSDGRMSGPHMEPTRDALALAAASMSRALGLHPSAQGGHVSEAHMRVILAVRCVLYAVRSSDELAAHA